MDATERMVALLGRMRRERNGAVADAMCCYGRPTGLNYGVSLPTVRQIARAEKPDREVARLLWAQDVRELRLAALHLMRPEWMTPDECERWSSGIINSELAEEAAFALLGEVPDPEGLFASWIGRAETPLLPYTVMMAAARSRHIGPSAAGEALRAAARAPQEYARLTAQGAVVLLAALAQRGEHARQEVLAAWRNRCNGEDSRFDLMRDELSWRLGEERL